MKFEVWKDEGKMNYWFFFYKNSMMSDEVVYNKL